MKLTYLGAHRELRAHRKAVETTDPAAASATFLKIDEVAKLLKLGRSTVYRYVLAGEIPHIRIGSNVRVPLRALEDWQRKRTVGG